MPDGVAGCGSRLEGGSPRIKACPLHTGYVVGVGMFVIGMLLVVGLGGSASDTATHTPGCAPGTATGSIDGRRYLVYVPATARIPAPTVVGFHGRLQTSHSQLTGTGLQALADREGFIVVAPQARGGRWDFRGSDTGFITDTLDNQDEDPAAIIAFHGTADQVVPFAGGLTASSATAPQADAGMGPAGRVPRVRAPHRP